MGKWYEYQLDGDKIIETSLSESADAQDGEPTTTVEESDAKDGAK